MNERRYNIRIAAGGRELVAIDDFRIAQSSLTVLFGESGIGKSLISLAIGGLLDPDDLKIHIDGTSYGTYLASQELAAIRDNGFFVFQEPSSHLNPLLTVREQLSEGSLGRAHEGNEIVRRLWQGASSGEVEKILDVYPKPFRPSGGEKQRILSAMAFKKMDAVGAEAAGSLFVFDEPTGNLDNRMRDEFLDMLVENFRRRQMTILLITHDYSMISRLTKEYPKIAERIFYKELLLDHGRLRLRDFLPREYLSWLGSRMKPSSRPAKGETIAEFWSGARVFGRDLVISRDRQAKEVEPLTIRKGTMTYLKAPSGTGKTTILKLMMGLLKADRMKMRLGGASSRRKLREMSGNNKSGGAA